MDSIRILITDDHEIAQKRIRKSLECQKDREVVAEASDEKEALQRIRRLNPDLVLTDIVRPEMK